jgi:hypothetical protein
MATGREDRLESCTAGSTTENLSSDTSGKPKPSGCTMERQELVLGRKLLEASEAGRLPDVQQLLQQGVNPDAFEDGVGSVELAQ